MQDASRTGWARIVRGEPYRLFFPLAVLLGGIGVGHWLLYVLGLQQGYSCQGHGFVQVQGFLMAFACGFLLTMLPRRSGLPPATLAELGIIAAGLIATTAAALAGSWSASEAAFLLVLAMLGNFAVRRMGGGRRAPPDAFTLIPIAVLHGALGAILVLVGASVGAAATTIGRGMLQEGVFLCLLLGIGHMVIPLLSGHPLPPDAAPTSASRRRRALHAAAGLAILLSFPLQHAIAEAIGRDAGTRAGCLLRACVFALDALLCMRAMRWPVVPGLHRRVAWLAFWMAPLGELLAGLLPAHRVPFLHVTFIGGFSLLCFAVATHVIASHSGALQIVSGRPWQVWLFGGLFLLAMGTRVTADFLAGDAYWLHVGGAAGLWLLALVAWAAWIMPRVIEIPPAADGSHDLPVIRQP